MCAANKSTLSPLQNSLDDVAATFLSREYPQSVQHQLKHTKTHRTWLECGDMTLAKCKQNLVVAMTTAR